MASAGPSLAPQQGDKRQFVIKACLGRGGFGEVYRASMTNANGLETDVAVKVLHTDLDRDSQGVQRLRDEGKMLGALIHPAILRVFDLVVLDGRVSLVTEYVEGQDLSKCIRNPGAMPPRAIVSVVGRVADALRAAWETQSATTGEPLHLIHRDVKPQNIRIGTQGDVKLLDFGVARSSQVGREAQTGTGHMVGSYLYMAPECLLENAFGRESDVFALGVTMYESLSHRRMFQDLSLREMYVLVLKDEDYAAWVGERLATVSAPEPVVALLRRMLARHAADRPTAAEVSAVCDDLADSLEGPTLRRWCKERDWPPTDHVSGLLDGRIITEATMASSLRPDFATLPPSPRRRRVDWGVVIGTLGTMSLIGGLVIGVLGLTIGLGGAFVMGSNPGVSPIRPPEAELVPSVDGTGYTSPRRTESGRGAPLPGPWGAATPAETPATPSLSTLLLNRVGPESLRVRRGGETFGNLTRVPYGTYGLEVDWRGEGYERIMDVQVRKPSTEISCNRLTRACDVK